MIKAPFSPEAAPRESSLILSTLDRAIGEIKPLDSPIKKNGPKMLKIFSGWKLQSARDKLAPERLESILDIRIFLSEK